MTPTLGLAHEMEERMTEARGWRFYLWKFVHNAIVHPFLSTPWEPKWLTRIHDWTGERCKGAG